MWTIHCYHIKILEIFYQACPKMILSIKLYYFTTYNIVLQRTNTFGAQIFLIRCQLILPRLLLIRGPKGPQLRLGNLQVGELQTLSPMYGTIPCCLVQAITRHTCPDPDMDLFNCLPHYTHIALSGSMRSADQLGLSLGSFPTFPSPLFPL